MCCGVILSVDLWICSLCQMLNETLLISCCARSPSKYCDWFGMYDMYVTRIAFVFRRN